MGIKLFHCKSCDIYFRNGSAVVTLRTAVRITETGQIKINDEEGCYDEVVDSFADVECYDCNERNTEVVELEKCTHRWQPYGRIGRRCDLCDKLQSGEVTFKDE